MSFLINSFKYAVANNTILNHATLATDILYYLKNDNATTEEVSSNTRVDSGTTYTTGFLGAAGLDFDGTNDYSYLTNACPSDSSRSISFWFNIDSTASTFCIYAHRDTSSARDFQIQLSSATPTVFNIQFYSSPTGGNAGFFQPAIGSTGVWQHFCLTQNGNTVKVFIDGVLRAYDTTAGKQSVARKPTFGRLGLTESSQYYNGKIDEYAYWTKTLTDGGVTTVGDPATGEVADLYNAGAGLPYD